MEAAPIAKHSPSFDLEKQYKKYHGVLKNAVEGAVVTRFPP
jgi:glutamyl-tRNA synthetase